MTRTPSKTKPSLIGTFLLAPVILAISYLASQGGTETFTLGRHNIHKSCGWTVTTRGGTLLGIVTDTGSPGDSRWSLQRTTGDSALHGTLRSWIYVQGRTLKDLLLQL